MNAKGILIAEDCHVVNALPPLDIDASAQNSDVWSMAKYAHASIIVQLGVTGATAVITVEECDDFTPSNSTAIAFASYSEVTANGDTLGARAQTSSAGLTTSANNGVFYVLEVDASQLSDGFPCMRVALTDPGAATFGSIVVILSGARYAGQDSPTAIA
jgi:hypothetical protein|tara:strand:+ start:2426 stop:2902 length:477 start_codon:yes stop_codon:yes gene_type:complete